MPSANGSRPVFSKVSHMSSTSTSPLDPARIAGEVVGWGSLLQPEMSDALCGALKQAYTKGSCHPVPSLWFDAFRAVGTPDDVRVCILGQDPYHGPGQANGLAFSVAKGLPIPPSLRNIYKEIVRDCGGTPPAHGDLNPWARQGVLLLNDVLSVEEGNAGSHSRFGWQEVTQSALAALDRRPVAFLLWGRHACSHRNRLAALHPEHLILEAVHPSPLSAHRGFMGCGHFGQVNRWLVEQGESPITWFDGLW